MSNIYIVGIAMTVFGRHPERSVNDLAREALGGALKDAGCAAADIGVAFHAGLTQGPLHGQLSIPGQVVLASLGLHSIPIFNVENACASGSTAVHLAVHSLKAGATDVALALGVEKMVIPDKARAMALFEGGWDVSRAEENYQTLLRMGEGVEPPPGSESERPYSKFMAIYAAFCRQHMKTYGTTRRQIAAVSAKNHWHSQHNSYAQFRKPFSVEEVLAAAPISYPLTVPMCAPLSDGAAGGLPCTPEGIARPGGGPCPRGRGGKHRRRGACSGRTWTWPRCMTPPPWARSSRSRTSALRHWAKAGRPRSVATSPWAGACTVTGPASWSPRATRWARPGWASSTSSRPSCAARQAPGRCLARATRCRKTAAASWASKKPPLPFTS